MKLLEQIRNRKISRRDFLKGSLTAAASVAGLGLTGCRDAGNLTTAAEDSANTEGAESAAAESGTEAASGQEMSFEDPDKGGTWITAACWHNCGGRCLNKALVVDGVVVRQKTDDTHEDTPDFPQQRGCLRGRSQRKQVFGADRLKYPMKRKNWQPGGGANARGELRGQDEWERISWDEAITYIADEMKRIKENYGNRAIFIPKGDEIMRTAGLFGGFCGYWNTNSFGSWAFTPRTVGFFLDVFDQTVNDRLDMRNCETIVMLSMNPAWSAQGSSSWHYMQAKKAGAKFIAIDPYYNETYSLLEADWIPVRPCTDTAFLLSLAYVLITEDDPETNPLIDWDFLNRCTIGFDEEHMPEGEDPKGNFKDYVLGTYDGVPKTPEWAEELTGAAPEKVRELAEAMGKDHKVAFYAGMASGRTRNSDNLPQMIMTIGAMTGHMGKSGHMTGSTMHATSGNGGPALVKVGGSGLPAIPNPVDDCINANQAWDAILTGKYNWTGSGGTHADNQYMQGEEREIDIHMIYQGGFAMLQTNDGMAKGIEATRKVDFVVSNAQFLTTNAKYSDIVLPVVTEWEKVGGFMGGNLRHTGNREMLITYSQVTEPLYECKSDQEVAMLIAEKLGIDPKEVYPFDDTQQYFNTMATCQVIKEDGSGYENLVAVTEEEIKELGVEGEPQEGRISMTEFREKGIYQVERKEGDPYGYIAYEKFREDPEANPLASSESGKLEIYSKKLADRINSMGYSEIRPIPTYIEVQGGYTHTFKDWEKKEKGEYPFQITNPHYLRRSHTVFDNVTWMREAYENPVFLNASDAKERQISEGDTVLITTPYGKTLRNAFLTERYMPGVIGLPHGAWVDVDEDTGIDKAGADNYISGQLPQGAGISGFNTNIGQIEKYTGEPLGRDVDVPQRIPVTE